ncbi:NADH-quinone oxidoreductase subunit F [Egibacter rhizosphaerae]|uniref:NADH-quinone oxidoreductase subunit F n=1 Tax=Egibacter rhizosphaerae TaxID=1670831 RepID=A0A411YAG9_9ACTN|nr:NADH-ubiquinone oxidoreductase-F iron-sulfur binding region domain-containing protein [Egibacter rhizosphaerae]QBI18195.1 NADH-quinone oxidoreductase subunit F [Egibacter rhizosphaerae]
MADGVYQILPEKPVETLEAYVAQGGGEGLENALAMTPDDIVAEIRAAGLRGRGGAGFPTGIKWRGVRDAGMADGRCYVVCNAAEGEPGTYKDRPLMERNPYQILEGMLICLYTTAAAHAYIATKERFTEAYRRLIEARDEMMAAGWEGAEHLTVVPGPDTYLFGEEKALLEVIEGKLSMPRLVPPFQVGLFATTTQPNPAVVNNAETFSHATQIIAKGADWFRTEGTEETPGTFLFAICQDVPNQGVYELPMGTSLRTLVCDIGGADPDDVKAIWSGVSNPVMTPDLLDLPLDFNSMAEAGFGLGSGGYAVYGQHRDMVQVTQQLERFLAIESCGQCNACKTGNIFMAERLWQLVQGEGTRADIDALMHRTEIVTDQNRCYLPVGAAFVVRSAIETFPEEFHGRVGAGPVPEEIRVLAPKIIDWDEDEGVLVFDPEYYRKRPDWTYAAPEAVEVPGELLP